jgi:hypothetical protein
MIALGTAGKFCGRDIHENLGSPTSSNSAQNGTNDQRNN